MPAGSCDGYGPRIDPHTPGLAGKEKTMRLTKTNGGNWAKQVRIGGGINGRAFFKTRAEANAAALPGEEVAAVVLGHKLAKRLYGVNEWKWIPNAIGPGSTITPMLAGEAVNAPKELLPSGGGTMDEQFAAYMVGSARAGRMVMQHASAAECLTSGYTPGPCNL